MNIYVRELQEEDYQNYINEINTKSNELMDYLEKNKNQLQILEEIGYKSKDQEILDFVLKIKLDMRKAELENKEYVMNENDKIFIQTKIK